MPITELFLRLHEEGGVDATVKDYTVLLRIEGASVEAEAYPVFTCREVSPEAAASRFVDTLRKALLIAKRLPIQED